MCILCRYKKHIRFPCTYNEEIRICFTFAYTLLSSTIQISLFYLLFFIQNKNNTFTEKKEKNKVTIHWIFNKNDKIILQFLSWSNWMTISFKDQCNWQKCRKTTSRLTPPFAFWISQDLILFHAIGYLLLFSPFEFNSFFAFFFNVDKCNHLSMNSHFFFCQLKFVKKIKSIFFFSCK